MLWQMQEEMSQRWRDWDEVDGEKEEVDSRQKVKHIERNDHLLVTRMMVVAEQD